MGSGEQGDGMSEREDMTTWACPRTKSDHVP
jgi:hypothetical protein